MGKRNKDQEPAANLNSVSNKDIIQRINFLYQASTYLGNIAQVPPEVKSAQNKQVPKRRKQNMIRHPNSAAELSRSYVNSMRIVGQKTMVRMDPSIKRTLCKQCDTVLIPGSTASIRVKSSGSHGQAVVYTCLSCKSFRRIPAPQVLDPDVAKDDSSSSALTDAVASTSTGIGESAMDVDTVDTTAPETAITRRPKPRKTRNRPARIPPLFERKGHVVFCGTEILTDH